MKILRIIFKNGWYFLKTIIFVSAIAAFTFQIARNAPQFEDHLIRYRVQSSMVYVGVARTVPSDQKLITWIHGSGFQVTAKSGKQFIVTNRHVCEDALGGIAYISQPGMKVQKLKVAAISLVTDLCLIEGATGMVSLSIAKNLSPGDEVISLGFPETFYATLAIGEAIGIQVEPDDTLQINTPADTARCLRYANTRIMPERDEDGKTISMCVSFTKGLITTVPTVVGESGSPLLNLNGQVVGVMFAKLTDASFGAAIPLHDLTAFLAQY